MWHPNAILVEDEDPPNIYRRARFLGRMTDPGVSFVGQLYWKWERGEYDHEADAWAHAMLRELDLREAASLGLL